jgi:hypothetical protein
MTFDPRVNLVLSNGLQQLVLMCYQGLKDSAKMVNLKLMFDVFVPFERIVGNVLRQGGRLGTSRLSKTHSVRRGKLGGTATNGRSERKGLSIGIAPLLGAGGN